MPNRWWVGAGHFFLYLQGAAESSRTSITLTCEHGHTGERDPEERESRDLHPYVIGDVLNDKSLIGDENYWTDTKRLQEPSGFILQSLWAPCQKNPARAEPRPAQ